MNLSILVILATQHSGLHKQSCFTALISAFPFHGCAKNTLQHQKDTHTWLLPSALIYFCLRLQYMSLSPMSKSWILCKDLATLKHLTALNKEEVLNFASSELLVWNQNATPKRVKNGNFAGYLRQSSYKRK